MLIVTEKKNAETIRSINVFDQGTGSRYELTSFKQGEVEVYLLDPTDGIFMFRGYQRKFLYEDANFYCAITKAWHDAWRPVLSR